MPKVDYPEFDKYPQLKGVFVGGCVARGDGSSFRAKAHAHARAPKDIAKAAKQFKEYCKFYHPDWSEDKIDDTVIAELNSVGWICLRSAKRLYRADGQPSNTMRHELAHILTGQGHTQTWANMARSLGCRIPKNRYRGVK